MAVITAADELKRTAGGEKSVPTENRQQSVKASEYLKYMYLC